MTASFSAVFVAIPMMIILMTSSCSAQYANPSPNALNVAPVAPGAQVAPQAPVAPQVAPMVPPVNPAAAATVPGMPSTSDVAPGAMPAVAPMVPVAPAQPAVPAGPPTCPNMWAGPTCSDCPVPYMGRQCNKCLHHGLTYPACFKHSAPNKAAAIRVQAFNQGKPYVPRCTLEKDCSVNGIVTAEQVVDTDGKCKCIKCLNKWTGKDTCKECKEPYTGGRCNQCQDPGLKFPACYSGFLTGKVHNWRAKSSLKCDKKKHCNGNGRHAYFDEVAGHCACECLNGWKGDHCELCPSEFTGKKCNECSHPGRGPFPNCYSSEEQNAIARRTLARTLGAIPVMPVSGVVA